MVATRAPVRTTSSAEHFGGALRAGLRFARASRELHLVLLRAALFFAFASAVWALLPAGRPQPARRRPGLLRRAARQPSAPGAIAGALVLLPRLRAALRRRTGLLLGGLARHGGRDGDPGAADRRSGRHVAILLLLGAAWITALTTLNGTTQAILPNWVRGRGLAIYLTVFNGAMAAGSIVLGLRSPS